MGSIFHLEKHLTQQVAAEILDVSQPRVSGLKCGKVDKFIIDVLVNFLTKLGHDVTVRIM
ncbi:MAG: XRE family transcriptional regulator [Mariprofundaceae bacterium]